MKSSTHLCLESLVIMTILPYGFKWVSEHANA